MILIFYGSWMVKGDKLTMPKMPHPSISRAVSRTEPDGHQLLVLTFRGQTHMRGWF
jgi:hypothetical protein